MDSVSIALGGVLLIGAVVLAMPEGSDAQLVRKMVAMVLGAVGAIVLALMFGCPQHQVHVSLPEPGDSAWIFTGR